MKNKIIVASIALASLIPLMGLVSCSEDSDTNSNPTSNSESSSRAEDIITLAKYNQILVGMSIEEVSRIFSGVTPDKETLNMSGLVSTVYQYKNPRGTSWVNVSVDTQDRVTFVSQFGLR